MTNNVLTKDATKQEIKEWLKLDNKRVEVDPADKVNMMDKIKQVINEGVEKNKTSNDESTDTHTDDGNDDNNDNKKVISKKSRTRTVEVHYRGSTSSTSWQVTFDLDKPQRLDQAGFSDLLMKILGDNVIFDNDRQIFWIYDSLRWVPLSAKSQELRQFTRQAVDIFIENILCVKYDIEYDPEQAFYLKVAKPQKDTNESEKDFNQRMTQYKAEINMVKRYNKFIDFIQRASVIDQAFKDLKGNMPKSNIEWDKDDYLLNCMNGVVDLRNGQMLKHDKKLYLTRIAPVNYNPDAKHPVLDRTLSISFQGDTEMIDYMQRQVGYFIVGGNINHKIFFWYGPKARNGKSVLGGTINKILGGKKKDFSGYALPVPVGTFLANKFGEDAKAADPNLANLQGVRLAIASEPDKGSRLAGGKIKELTGDGTATARHLHQDPVTFDRKFKILIMCNFMPLSDGDPSIRRRTVITPFDHHVKEGSLEDDPEAQHKLWEEREGVLAWMVEGAVRNYKTVQERKVKKAKLTKQAQAEGKSLEDTTNDEDTAEDPLHPRPKEAVEALDSYMFSANSVTQFLHESTMSKHEYWKYIFETIFRTFDQNRYFEAYQMKDRKEWEQRNFDEHYFTEQKLLLLPNAFILRSKLFKLYQNYCKLNGIKHPATSHDFYDMTNRYFAPAKTNRGYVYLGVTMTPVAGTDQYHNNELKYVQSEFGFKELIYHLADNALHRVSIAAINKDDDRSLNLKQLYCNLELKKNQTISTVQLNRLYRAVKNDSNMYFGRMIGTLSTDDIDFKKEEQILKDRGVDYSKDDDHDTKITDQDRTALFG